MKDSTVHYIQMNIKAINNMSRATEFTEDNSIYVIDVSIIYNHFS